MTRPIAGVDETMAAEEKLRAYLKLVTANLRDTRRQLDEAQQRDNQPIRMANVLFGTD